MLACFAQSAQSVVSPTDEVGGELPDVAQRYDFNGDGHPNYVLRTNLNETAIWYLNNNPYLGRATGPPLSQYWDLIDVADFNGNGHPDYALFNWRTGETAIWYLNNNRFVSAKDGPKLPAGWALVAVGDFSGDGKPDYVLYQVRTHKTAIWYMTDNVVRSKGFGPGPVPSGWKLVGAADFDLNGHADYLLANSGIGKTAIWYMSGRALLPPPSAKFGPTIDVGFELKGATDYNGDRYPDYVLFNCSTKDTKIWYLTTNVRLDPPADGPRIERRWNLALP